MSFPVLITGASQRIGLAIAEGLLEQGESVVFTYRTHKPAVDMLISKGATAIRADFSTQSSIDRAIVEIKQVSAFYRAIIHNASDWSKDGELNEDHGIMERMMCIHAITPYRINRALANALLTREGPADIIHLTDYVQETGSEKHMAYAASKAALHNLTLSFAKQLAPKVKVNTIAPALIMFNEWDSEEYRAKTLQKSLTENEPGPHQVVDTVTYLLNSNYITGQAIHLNGGRHLK